MMTVGEFEAAAQRLYEQRKASWMFTWEQTSSDVRDNYRELARRELRTVLHV